MDDNQFDEQVLSNIPGAQDVMQQQQQQTQQQQQGGGGLLGSAMSAFGGGNKNSGGVIHDCVLMTHFETVVAKLSAALNHIRKLFPDSEKLKPFFGWASTDKIKTVLDKTTQDHRGVTHFSVPQAFQVKTPWCQCPMSQRVDGHGHVF